MSRINKTVEEAMGDVTLNRLESLLSTMFEGGIGYWAELTYDKGKYQEAKQQLIDAGKQNQLAWELVLAQMLLNGGKLVIIEDEDSKNHDLTLDVLKKGIQLWILNPQYHNCGDIWDECDAIDADIICQFALFEDIIYS